MNTLRLIAVMCIFVGALFVIVSFLGVLTHGGLVLAGVVPVAAPPPHWTLLLLCGVWVLVLGGLAAIGVKAIERW